MKHSRRSRRLTCLLAAWLVLSVPTSVTAQRGVLIGVSQFDHLPIRPLDGPPNDVMLMSDTLVGLGVREQNIVKLADSASSELLPRRENILRVLREQALQGRRGETVVVYFSGHGAQVPQAMPVAKGGWIEPDGLDEVFLTRSGSAKLNSGISGNCGHHAGLMTVWQAGVRAEIDNEADSGKEAAPQVNGGFQSESCLSRAA